MFKLTTKLYTFDGTTFGISQDTDDWHDVCYVFEDASLPCGKLEFYYQGTPRAAGKKLQADIEKRINALTNWYGEESRGWMINRLQFIANKGLSTGLVTDAVEIFALRERRAEIERQLATIDKRLARLGA